MAMYDACVLLDFENRIGHDRQRAQGYFSVLTDGLSVVLRLDI